MSDKKIIITAIILSLALIGGGWYYSKNHPPTAAIVNSPKTNQLPVSVAGISLGNPAAPVVIEEYTNFLCPACASFALVTFDQIKEDYIKPGRVKFIFYIFPPLELAQAAICAEEQGKFAEYHAYVFEHQTQITKEGDLKDFAVNVGIDGTQFAACYAKEEIKTKAAKWTEEGNKREIDSTPTFFINGQKLVGAQPYSDFKKIIDEKLNQGQ